MHENLCEYITTELEELDRKAKNGKLTAAEVEYGDTLAHFEKCLLTSDAMKEGDGYYSRGSYRGGMMYHDGRGRSYEWDGMSHAGRRNARRDSMGRYSGNYSYHDSMDELLEDMRGMMDQLPEEKRRKAERLVDELSR